MNIIITGASSGIGFETARLFSKDKTNTVIAISRNQEKLEHLKAKCEQENKDAHVIVIPFDLSSEALESSLIPEIKKHVPTVDLLINNAGSLINKSFKEITLEEMQQVYRTNVFSVMQLIQATLPIMNTESISHILNISSMGGVQGSVKFPGLSVYSSSKAALANLTECLAEELKESPIHINCLALGAVQTPMLEKAFPGYAAGVTPEEMARFIVSFCMNDARLFNGKIIPVSATTP